MLHRERNLLFPKYMKGDQCEVCGSIAILSQLILFVIGPVSVSTMVMTTERVSARRLDFINGARSIWEL